jgi:hypothetical protein
VPDRQGHYKDVVLDGLARRANVAQFVSFGPDLAERHAWVCGWPPNHRFGSPEAAVAAVFAASPESSVNVRSYEPHDPKARRFLYGLKSAEEALAAVSRLAGEGLYTIVNETVDVLDGGVSGVAFGDVLEFAPGDTPRCVETGDTAALPRALGLSLLATVYRFAPALPEQPELRVEWSLHPLRRGYRHKHTILWEIEEPGAAPESLALSWPHRFSRHLGDKAFGLLMADAVGLRVPRTEVLPRGLAPFSFGADTGLAETWLRTCPREQRPGLFTTRHGWEDPFLLLAREDPEGREIASVLCQQAVEARHSGAVVTQADDRPRIEGVRGSGVELMLGRRAPEELPAAVSEAVREVYSQAVAAFGAVRFEWVHDGAAVWIVQLHRGASTTEGKTIHPGEAKCYHPFEIEKGLEALRELIARVQGTGEGIVLVGRVGVTSHMGDLLRRARIPSRLEEGGSGRP